MKKNSKKEAKGKKVYAPVESALGALPNELEEIVTNSDSSTLANAKSNWYFGEWQALAEINIAKLGNHPDVPILAALKAAGYQQLDDLDNCRKYINVARRLGCQKEIITKLLIAGVHNSLAKLAAIQKDDNRVLHHFNSAIDLGGRSQQAKLARHARSVKEMTRLGLLPQAAKLIDEEAKVATSYSSLPKENEARIGMLRSEVELINHELALAFEKRQLYETKNENETPKTSPDKNDLENLKKLSPSQLGQDLWVLEKTSYKNGGYFVEFGASDGILLSNTYLLEKEFEWNGICAEPNPNFFKKLKKNRSCIISDQCISEKSGENVSFVLANEFGGIDGIADKGLHADKVNSFKSANHKIELTTVSLNDFLIQNNAPKCIDYLSIDTEGSEYLIIKDFPFNNWRIKLITIEHNYEPHREKIYLLLKSYGYSRIERQWDDWYFK